jgi:ABC-type glycerol-3-phosphate transport system substrate-binding protein
MSTTAGSDWERLSSRMWGTSPLQRTLRCSLIVLMAAWLAGCGNGDSSDAGGGETAQDSLEGASVTSTFMEAGTYDAAAQDLQAEFEDETNIDLEIVTFPWVALIQNHMTDLTTRTGEFDVISSNEAIATVFQHLHPLDDYLADYEYRDEFIEGILDPGPSSYFDGQAVGVPYSMDSYGILYRTDLFEESGVEADWESWDDLFDAADRLAEDHDGIAPLVFSHGAIEQLPGIFVSAYGGTYVSEDNTYEVEPDLAIPALEAVSRSVEYGPSNALSLSIDEANAEFLQGRAAMLVGWPSFVRGAADDPDQSEVAGNWQLAHMPGPGIHWIANWNFMITSESENPDAAWAWIEYYLNPDNAKRFMQDYGIGSPFQSTYEDADVLAGHEHDYPQQAENLQNARVLPLTAEAEEVMSRELSEMITNNLPPEQVIERWHSRWSELDIPQAMIDLAEQQGFKRG